MLSPASCSCLVVSWDGKQTGGQEGNGRAQQSRPPSPLICLDLPSVKREQIGTVDAQLSRAERTRDLVLILTCTHVCTCTQTQKYTHTWGGSRRRNAHPTFLPLMPHLEPNSLMYCGSQAEAYTVSAALPRPPPILGLQTPTPFHRQLLGTPAYI